MKAYLIVGDAFVQFAEAEQVLTVSALRRSLEANEAWLVGANFIVGQGLGEEDLREVRRLVDARGLGGSFTFPDPLAPLSLTHKRDPANSLITTPVQVGERRYAFSFALNDRMDRLADHVTGRHVGGMLLVEAARQSSLAVLELEFKTDGGVRYGLSWNSLNVRFMNFAFPAPLNLVTEVSEGVRDAKGQIAAKVVTEILQAGTQVAVAEMDVGLIDASALAGVEARRAHRAIERALEAPAERRLHVA
jgi:hypothetical protein